jgi:hypothetical protein
MLLNSSLIAYGIWTGSYVKATQRLKGHRENDVEVAKYGAFSDEYIKDYLQRSNEQLSEFLRPPPNY